MTTFFTSDTHFGHDSIIKLANRPFSSVEEMDETMVQRWNERVRPGDLVYHLGDFALKQTREQTQRVHERLNGTIYLLEGNHESNALAIKRRFLHVTEYKKIDIGGQKIVLFHYPIRSWDGIFKGSWHLYGHVHGLLPSFGKSFDIGVDNHNFYPLSFEEVREYMSTRPLMTEEEGFPGYIPLEKRF
jgi:calcineurin-like phosphoesterase family protein